jgi:hypothetical protein
METGCTLCGVDYGGSLHNKIAHENSARHRARLAHREGQTPETIEPTTPQHENEEMGEVEKSNFPIEPGRIITSLLDCWPENMVVVNCLGNLHLLCIVLEIDAEDSFVVPCDFRLYTVDRSLVQPTKDISL